MKNSDRRKERDKDGKSRQTDTHTQRNSQTRRRSDKDKDRDGQTDTDTQTRRQAGRHAPFVDPLRDLRIIVQGPALVLLLLLAPRGGHWRGNRREYRAAEVRERLVEIIILQVSLLLPVPAQNGFSEPVVEADLRIRGEERRGGGEGEVTRESIR